MNLQPGIDMVNQYKQIYYDWTHHIGYIKIVLKEIQVQTTPNSGKVPVFSPVA